MTLPTEDPAIMQRIEFHLRLRRVWQYLEQSNNEHINLATGAEVACMEKTAFSRFFRRATGVSFHDFVLSWRLQRAVHLMADSDQSITEIAFEVGFQNLATFERSFRRFFACCPLRYRTNLLKNRGLIPEATELPNISKGSSSEKQNTISDL